ncbi:MAG: ketol-acid reductoisomerase [Bacillota bacterium]
MSKLYYEKDCNLNALKGKTVAIIGYGSQGHAHAQNLKDSGVNTIIGLRTSSKSFEVAKKDGFEVYETGEAVKRGDIIMMLAPDQNQTEIYNESIKGNLSAGNCLAFAHGFAIHFNQITPPEDVNVFMIAPKGPGHVLRQMYTEGQGIPCLVAIHKDATGDTLETALAYGAGIGGARAGIFETTFEEETETDLFGEQAVLCGGVCELMKAGFDTLTEAGYAPEMAYFECVHEMKLIIDLIYSKGFDYMRYSISDTAEYGDYKSGTRIITEDTRKEMKKMLAEIQDGTFASTWISENNSGGRAHFLALRRKENAHPMISVGKELRKLMSWLNK